MTMVPFSCHALDNPLRLYTSLAVFLLGAIALIVPSGYSVGAVLLLVGSLVLIFRRENLWLGRDDWLIILVLLAYSLVGMLEAWWDGAGSRGFDKPSRFLLAVPPMLLLLAYPPRLAMLWAGLAFGGVSSGIWAIWQKLIEGEARAGGFTFVIQFGNISMLMGVLCLAGLGWAARQPRARLWLTLLFLGALGGILSSLFSGSRGGWIGFPIVLWVLYRGYGHELSAKLKLLALAVVLVGASSVYALPQTGVKHRVHLAISDISRYVAEGDQTTSVGSRFALWEGAAHLILDKPVFGWGKNGYKEAMMELGRKDVISSEVTLRYDHAHNEFIDAAAKRGLIGLLTLSALYLVPMALFARQLHAQDLQLRALAVAGVLLPVMYIDFGLTQVLMEHNSGVMIYAFWLVVLWSQFRVVGERALRA